MRVLMLSKACIVGAYQRKLEELAALAPEMELTVAVPPYWKGERGAVTVLERAYIRGYQLAVLPMALNGQFHLHFYPQLGRLLQQVRPDLVHIDEEPYNVATWQANVLARRGGAKTLWFSWQNLRRTYPPPWRWLERYNLQHVEYALMGSQTAAQVWREKGYTGPLAVVPQFGVDPDLFMPPASPRPDGPLHIAYVGRLVAEKGVDVLLTALAGLEGDWRLSIQSSGGPELAALQSQAAPFGERITFCDPLPSLGLPAFYRTVDVLVLPSRSRPNWTEQFGRVLIEAMACGAVVMGAQTGEIPAVIGDAGLTFPEGDAVALRAGLRQLRAAPALRQALSVRGRARVLAHFTQRHIAAATLAVYRELLP